MILCLHIICMEYLYAVCEYFFLFSSLISCFYYSEIHSVSAWFCPVEYHHRQYHYRFNRMFALFALTVYSSFGKPWQTFASLYYIILYYYLLFIILCSFQCIHFIRLNFTLCVQLVQLLQYLDESLVSGPCFAFYISLTSSHK